MDNRYDEAKDFSKIYHLIKNIDKYKPGYERNDNESTLIYGSEIKIRGVKQSLWYLYTQREKIKQIQTVKKDNLYFSGTNA